MPKNDQTKQFFEDVFDDSMYHEYEHIVYAGYFNVALNHKIYT